MKKIIDIVIPTFQADLYLIDLLKAIAIIEFPENYTLGNVLLVLDGPQGLKEHINKERLIKDFPFVKIIALLKNHGQYTATLIGMQNAKADYIVTMDDDYQHDPKYILWMLHEMEASNSDLVYGKFLEKEDKHYKNLGGKLLRFLIKKTHPISQNASGYRLISSHIIMGINNPIQSAFLDEFLWQYANKHSFIEIPHLHSKRDGTTYSKAKLFKQAINILLFHTSIPLKWMTRLGVIMAFLFFFIGLYRIYLKWTQDIALGFTSLIVAIFFSTSLLLLCLGVIGEYIRRIWLHQNQLNLVKFKTYEDKSQ
ncbi:MAG TPA: glycosyltransferase [Chitinophagaceae bacterium]|nr:glycosyltransferase [Chitinophagaceae bacterium]